MDALPRASEDARGERGWALRDRSRQLVQGDYVRPCLLSRLELLALRRRSEVRQGLSRSALELGNGCSVAVPSKASRGERGTIEAYVPRKVERAADRAGVAAASAPDLGGLEGGRQRMREERRTTTRRAGAEECRHTICGGACGRHVAWVFESSWQSVALDVWIWSLGRELC